MSRVRIEVVVAADGAVTATTHNTHGEECLPYIQTLEALLDAQAVDSAYTDDWWKTASATRSEERANQAQAPNTIASASVTDTTAVRDYDR